MHHFLLKLPIYWIIIYKLMVIVRVKAKLIENGRLTQQDGFALSFFMGVFGALFVVALLI